jgi:molecular chaperone GrpE
MSYYNRYQRNPRQGSTRTLTLDQIKQIETTLQELEQEATKWKELAQKWEVTAKEEQQRAGQLEEQLKEQRDEMLKVQEQVAEDRERADIKREGQDPFAQAEDKINRMEQDLARAQADYGNARRRLEIRFANLLDQNIMEFLLDLLPVLDNLERAIQHAPEDSDSEGVKMTQQMFLSTLDKHGVKPIEALGKVFDPQHHEAIGVVEDADLPPGSVAAVDQPGFMYRDKVLRPVRVLITPEE